ncbi:hypothetical protein [Devosia sp.]|uniref:hypothetical protein n=1 Tax=Devosia sp. TaxID=1871048 RepID=UPI001ACA012A|nr:hypothetical protein [Devosia sp.]MBN9336128.1 hypothetical protein [Devosia sp.]
MKLNELLPKILRATSEGKLRWFPGTMKNSFQADLAGIRLLSNYWMDEDTGEPGYTLASYRGETFLESVYGDKFSTHYSALESVYDAARHDALNLGQVVEELSEELDRIMKM